MSFDGLLCHQSDVAVRRHHTDGGGDAEHVFALLALLGFQFAPRIPDLKSRRLYSFAKSSTYPTLEPLIAGRINVALIRTHWAEILRVAASIRTGTVTASLISQLVASERGRAPRGEPASRWEAAANPWLGAIAPCVRTLYFAYLDEFPLPRGWAANITGSPAPERAGSSPPGASRS
jgi:hypothetical protein